MIGNRLRLVLTVTGLGFAAVLSFPAAPSLAPAHAEDLLSPAITEVKIKAVAATSTVITWKTDEESDSTVQFGLTKNFGVAREPDPTLLSHEVAIPDLEPSTTYVFRVVSTDPSGNQSFSGNFTFTTRGTKQIKDIQEVKDPQQRAATEKIVELLDKITDQQALEIVDRQVQATGEGALDAPRILGDPDIVVEADRAVIRWETDKEANGIVEFATEGQFQSGGYARQEGDADEMSTRHEVTLFGLTPQTAYHFQITSRSRVGPTGKSEDKTFTTKSILPQISAIRLVKVEEDSATLTWSTQVPAAALVEYTNLNTKETKSIGNPSLQVSHTIRLPDLKFKSPYQVIIKARTPSGDEIPSQPISFVTVKDDSPPIISQVSNESTLYPGADAKVQTIVSWDTDEPSICQLFYNQGIGEKDAESQPEETGALIKHAQVVTEFTPSTVYQFWVRCRDRNDNQSRSENFVLFTPEKEKSIIDIILENFEGTFGWVKNIGK